MNKKVWITNVIISASIVLLTILGVFLMFFGPGGALAEARWDVFKYFTVQSNLFVAITAGISLFYLLFKKDKEYPGWLIISKLVSAVSVGITFFVVIIYLGPIYGYPFLYSGANFLFHGLVPALAMVAFILAEPKHKFKFINNIYSLIPVAIYGTIYMINVAVHNDYGNYKGNDWYAFGTYGPGIGVVFLFGIIAMEFILSIALYFLYQKTTIKKLHE